MVRNSRNSRNSSARSDGRGRSSHKSSNAKSYAGAGRARSRRRTAGLDGSSGAHTRAASSSDRDRGFAPAAAERGRDSCSSADTGPIPKQSARDYSRSSGKYSSRARSRAREEDEGASRRDTRRRGSSTKKRVIGAVVVVLVVCLLGAGTAAALWYNGLTETLRGDNQITNTQVEESGDPYYVLLLGGDSRDDTNEDNRTDSIMVARVDEKNQNVSILSVPRDTRVYIDDHGYCKINAAIEYGGYNRVVECVNDILGIQINYYAFIYFDGFRDLVEALGGVTVAVPEGTYYDGTWVPAGDAVEIDGDEALVLARCRHGYPPDTGAYAMGDFQRTLNQRNLIKAIAKKVLEQDVAQMPSLIEGLAKCVETNMDASKIVSLAEGMKGMDTDEIDAAQLGIAGATIKGEWFGIIYKDVYEVMKANFTAGRDLLDGLGNYNVETNDSDCGSSYTDGPLFSYTSYTELYGDPTGTGKATSDSDRTQKLGSQATESSTRSASGSSGSSTSSSGRSSYSGSSYSSSGSSSSYAYDDDDDE